MTTTTVRQPRDRAGGLLAAIAVGAFFVFVAVVGGLNVLDFRPLPDDPRSRAYLYLAVEDYVSADTALRDAVEANPRDIDLHYDYISNFYLNVLPFAEDSEDTTPDDTAIVVYYGQLAADPETADIGNYGLGLIASLQEDYETALSLFERVRNRDMKYLNNSTGFALEMLGQTAEAEALYWQEISLEGFVAGATQNLEALYYEQDRIEDLRRLLDNPVTREFVSGDAARLVALSEGDPGFYFDQLFLSPLRFIRPLAGLSALVVAVMWLLYFWRVDVFEQEPLGASLMAFLLGAAFAPVTILLSDAISLLVFPLAYGNNAIDDLIYMLFYVALPEEIVKFAALLLTVTLTRQANEPLDYVIYGSMAALGFATLENALYFSGFGLEIVFARFLLSTTLHMVDTTFIAYFWAMARFRSRSQLGGIIAGFCLAIVSHGFYNWFLGETVGLAIVSIVLTVFLVGVYGRMLNNAINASPHFHPHLATSDRLNNIALILGVVFFMAMITYIYNHVTFGTTIANENIAGLVLLVIFPGVWIFTELGEFTANEGERLPLFGRTKKKEEDPDAAVDALFEDDTIFEEK